MIAGLVAALNQGALMKQLQEIKATVDTKKEIPKAPPPPPPDLVKPPPPFVPPPEFVIQSDAPATNAITTTNRPPPPVQAAPPAPPAPPPTKLEARTATHTQPEYPDISKRLNEQGVVQLKVTIDTSGNCTAADIVKSSGFDRLDQTAAAWVKSHWKWKPPTTNGQPSEAATMVAIKFDLKSQ